ncbi:MAG TPA: response regulator transcription factor [Solirubrobacteraceae bacterium]|nr:response regulator transcription factor [Solirubrobacteraceae bacterium]
MVADDERRLADTLARGLRTQGLAVDVAHDGDEALHKARVYPYDVVVLDRDMPRLHGDEVCRALNAEQPRIKVLMLTAASSLDDMVSGLGLGADDYMTKPFAFAELVARVQALGRRSGQARAAVLRRAGVELDPAERTVRRDGRLVPTSPKEFGVLEALLAAEGATVSAEELLARVWDENADPVTNSVRMTVVTLRRKLGDPPVVHTVRGAGYRV